MGDSVVLCTWMVHGCVVLVHMVRIFGDIAMSIRFQTVHTRHNLFEELE